MNRARGDQQSSRWGGRGMLRWVPLAAVVAMLAAAMLAAAFANPTIEYATPRILPTQTRGDNQAEAAPTLAVETASPRPADLGPVLPAWVGWVVSALCAAGVIAVVGTLMWLLFRDRLAARKTPSALELSAPPTIEETRQQVRAALEEGLAELDDASADPRRTVIACWVRLEGAAAAAGVERKPGDTSTDLVRRLLATHLVSGAVLAAFAEVYREARFATHAVDVVARDQARAALSRLRDELSVGV